METVVNTSSIIDLETSEKRIRTFEGDMKVVKSGGKPDLTPFVSVRSDTISAPKESPVITVPTPSRVEVSIPVPSAPVQVSEPLPKIDESRQEIQTPSAVQNTVSKPVQSNSSFIETYAGDFADKMKNEHASPVTVLAAEQNSLSYDPTVIPEKSSRNNYFYIVAGMILFIGGGAGVYVTYTRYLANTLPILVTSVASVPMFVDEREQITGNDSVLEQAILKSVARSLASGNVRLLYDVDTTAGSIFSRLPFIPDVLVRNVYTDNSVAGVIHINNIQSPFFVLPVTSYGNSFSGMLSWEASMPYTLGTLFPSYPSSSVLSNATSSTQVETTTKSVATTTSLVSVQGGFRDEVVSNHDVRVYRDSEGRSVILYGYWDRSTLIIARDPKAFIEIIQRIAHSRSK